MASPSAIEFGKTLKRARLAAKFTNAHSFLAAVKEEQGSAPSYSSYAQWESGEVSPRDDSLAPIQRFHENRGTWQKFTPAPDLATALHALADELREARQERTELRQEVAMLRAERAAWEQGVIRVLRAASEGQVSAALLDALAPQRPEDVRPERVSV